MDMYYGSMNLGRNALNEHLSKIGWEERTRKWDDKEWVEAHERYWDRTNKLFEKFIHELFEDTIKSFDELASCGFFNYFYENYLLIDDEWVEYRDMFYE